MPLDWSCSRVDGRVAGRPAFQPFSFLRIKIEIPSFTSQRLTIMQMLKCLKVTGVLVVSFIATAAGQKLHITPDRVLLSGKFQQAQLLVNQKNSSNTSAIGLDDLTAAANYTVLDPNVARVDTQGRITALRDGITKVTVAYQNLVQEIFVEVQGEKTSQIEFTQDILPILNKAGCAAGACHASQFGKGGFKLSIFGFDPQADFRAIARASRGRRLNFGSPKFSLLMAKPAMQVPHGGGRRLDPETIGYEIMREWISNGATTPADKPVKAISLHVTPGQRATKLDETQQLRAVVKYSDASFRDVTSFARYDVMDEGVLSVTSNGLVTATGKGQSAVMVRYEGQVEAVTFVVPFGNRTRLANWKNHNFIDELAANKFRELQLEPSALCDDATFLRRAFLDAIGGLPTLTETSAFLASQDPQKRTHLVERLLGLAKDPAENVYNDRYASFWTLKWSDLIRNNSNDLGEQGMWALHNWIKESFRTNKPYDQFVRELVTAKGSIYSSGPANYFRINGNASELTEATSQLFLGLRLECAKCHHHPFESYSQADYYGLAAFFARVGQKGSEEFGLFGGESVIVVRDTGEVKHPRTGQQMQPTPLAGKPIDHQLDRRIPLARWLTGPDNNLFAESVVNRYVGYLLGRGLVEPIDDMRSTNPPSNTELLGALSQTLADSGFDLKQLMHAIMTSRLYQLSSQPTEQNFSDRRFYSHYRVKRLAAEPLLDAIDQAVGANTKFKNLPPGTRATELPDAEYPNYFLKTFAKPRRASVCECERVPDENLAQALHTLNGDILAEKISGKNSRIGTLLANKTGHDDIVNQLFLATLIRRPSPQELAFSRELLQNSPSPKECYEDLLWALINSKQFLFVH